MQIIITQGNGVTMKRQLSDRCPYNIKKHDVIPDPSPAVPPSGWDPSVDRSLCINWEHSYHYKCKYLVPCAEGGHKEDHRCKKEMLLKKIKELQDL